MQYKLCFKENIKATWKDLALCGQNDVSKKTLKFSSYDNAYKFREVCYPEFSGCEIIIVPIEWKE